MLCSVIYVPQEITRKFLLWAIHTLIMSCSILILFLWSLVSCNADMLFHPSSAPKAKNMDSTLGRGPFMPSGLKKRQEFSKFDQNSVADHHHHHHHHHHNDPGVNSVTINHQLYHHDRRETLASSSSFAVSDRERDVKESTRNDEEEVASIDDYTPAHQTPPIHNRGN